MTGQIYVLGGEFTPHSKRAAKKGPKLADTAYHRQPFPEEELATEEWQPVRGHETRYEISTLGRIRSAPKVHKLGRKKKLGVLSTRRGKDGYEHFVSSFIDETGTRLSVHIRVHRAVAIAFIPNPNDCPIVNHKDGDKLRNEASNLEWVTYKENTHHAIENGLIDIDSLRKLHTYSSRANPKKRNPESTTLSSSSHE